MIYLFEDCSLDTKRRELRRANHLVDIEPQVFDLLEYLIRNRERVVCKDDLITHVWNGRIVSESTLTSRITIARQAIGDNGAAQKLIRTIRRKGIRFVGAVSEDQDSGSVVSSTQVAQDIPIATLFGGIATPRLPDKPSIAVLPFTNMSGDAEQEYFSDGITEDIITALSRLRWFFVIARNSTFAYKGRNTDVRLVGRDLGVRYILEGSVRKSGHRVRITSQLLDAISGNHIWADRYDRELTDIFALQDEITVSVTAAIEPKLLAAEALRVETRSVDDLDAWDLVARALSHFWKLTLVENKAACSILRQAVERHPNYAPAHSMLAFALLVSSYVGWSFVDSDRVVAARLASRAAELDSCDPWAHMALGFLALTSRQTEQAVRHFQVALDLNPNFAAAAGSIGIALAHNGQSEEAMLHFDQAMRMSPRDPFNSFFVLGISVAHYLAGRYSDAAKWAREGLRLRPGSPGGHCVLSASLAQAGNIKEAQAALSMVRQLQPHISRAWVKQWSPVADDKMEKYLEGLRKAGLTD
jgi:TolB-like protein